MYPIDSRKYVDYVIFYKHFRLICLLLLPLPRKLYFHPYLLVSLQDYTKTTEQITTKLKWLPRGTVNLSTRPHAEGKLSEVQ